MNRPPHVVRAIDALWTVAQNAGVVSFGDFCEIKSYVAKLERDLAEAERQLREPRTWRSWWRA